MILGGPGYAKLTERDCDVYYLSSKCMAKMGCPYSGENKFHKLGQIRRLDGMEWVRQEALAI